MREAYDWGSRDNIQLIYAKWFYGPHTHPEGMLLAYAYWSEDGREIIGGLVLGFPAVVRRQRGPGQAPDLGGHARQLAFTHAVPSIIPVQHGMFLTTVTATLDESQGAGRCGTTRRTSREGQPARAAEIISALPCGSGEASASQTQVCGRFLPGGGTCRDPVPRL